jgi:hypothetical protein
VCVRAWAGLHAKPQNHATKGTRQPKPLICGALLPVAVSRLPRPTRTPQPPWLWWQGLGEPNLALLWRAYVRRFDQEHTLRFLKGRLDLDHAPGAHPGASRPLDLAGAAGLHPVAVGSPGGR